MTQQLVSDTRVSEWHNSHASGWSNSQWEIQQAVRDTTVSKRPNSQWVTQWSVSDPTVNERHNGQWVTQKSMRDTRVNEWHKSQWVTQQSVSDTTVNEWHNSQWETQQSVRELIDTKIRDQIAGAHTNYYQWEGDAMPLSNHSLVGGFCTKCSENIIPYNQ